MLCQHAPKRPLQEAPRPPPTVARGSKIAPRGSQDHPKRPSERPRASQDPPSGTIKPLLSEYAQSHSIHYTFIDWKFSRNHQKHPELFKTNILEPPSFQASLPLSLQVPAAKRLGGCREAQTIIIIIAPRLLPFRRHPAVGSGPKLEEMNPRTFPDLPICPRTLDFDQKT